MVLALPSNQALVMSVISGIVFFIVGNPVTYAMVSKITNYLLKSNHNISY